MSETSLRTFVAIPIPMTLKRELVHYQGQVLRNPRRLKIVKPDNFHITLAFLGDLTLEQRATITAGARDVAAFHQPFLIEIGGIQLLPGVIAIPAISGREVLVAMTLQLAEVASRIGISVDRRPPQPHITLARLHDRAEDPHECCDEEGAEEEYRWTCQSLAIYASHLESSGARYEQLERIALGAPREDGV